MKSIPGLVIMRFYTDGDLYTREEMLGNKVYTQENDAVVAMIEFATDVLGYKKYYVTPELVLSGYYQVEIDDGVFKELSIELLRVKEVEILTD